MGGKCGFWGEFGCFLVFWGCDGAVLGSKRAMWYISEVGLLKKWVKVFEWGGVRLGEFIGRLLFSMGVDSRLSTCDSRGGFWGELGGWEAVF